MQLASSAKVAFLSRLVFPLAYSLNQHNNALKDLDNSKVSVPGAFTLRIKDGHNTNNSFKALQQVTWDITPFLTALMRSRARLEYFTMRGSRGTCLKVLGRMSSWDRVAESKRGKHLNKKKTSEHLHFCGKFASMCLGASAGLTIQKGRAFSKRQA